MSAPPNEKRRPSPGRRSSQTLGGGSTTPRYTRATPEQFDPFTMNRLACVRQTLINDLIDSVAEISRLKPDGAARLDEWDRHQPFRSEVSTLQCLATRLYMVAELERWPFEDNPLAHLLTERDWL